jgi:RNA polymerase sigma-70 factor (ECF subfamily)
LTDQHLLSAERRERLLEGACQRLHEIAHRMLRGFPHVRRWEETDDVAQAAALRLHRALATVVPRDERHFLGLMVTQVRRELIDLARRYSGPTSFAAHHETNVLDLPAGHLERVSFAATHRDESPEALMSWTRFHEIAAALPEEEREMFGLVWYAAATQDEIATLLGLSPRTVRRRWERTKRCFLRQLEGLQGEDAHGDHDDIR